MTRGSKDQGQGDRAMPALLQQVSIYFPVSLSLCSRRPWFGSLHLEKMNFGLWAGAGMPPSLTPDLRHTAALPWQCETESGPVILAPGQEEKQHALSVLLSHLKNRKSAANLLHQSPLRLCLERWGGKFDGKGSVQVSAVSCPRRPHPAFPSALPGPHQERMVAHKADSGSPSRHGGRRRKRTGAAAGVQEQMRYY